jgi:uncharacterized repeat protein (TIGR01451 family)
LAPARPQTAPLAVLASPTIVEAFGATTLTLGDSTSLTFTISNPNSTDALTGIAFSDPFPSGLVVAYPNGLTGSCGGGTVTAVPSTSVVRLVGASLAASTSCTFSINVIGSAPGMQANTTGNITSTNGGTGGTATASILAGTPGNISMSFNPPSIPLNGTSELTISLYNPETSDTDLLGISLTDTLPAGLSVEDSSASVCSDGTLTTSGGNTISLSGDDLYIGWVCSFTVTVTAPGVPGAYTNTAGPIIQEGGIPSHSASATLNVLVPPAIAMAFHPTTTTPGVASSLTFTVTNPAANTADLTGVAVTASLPAGLTVENGSLAACGGTVTSSGGKTISLAGATVAVGSVCTFSIDVTGAVLGHYTSASGAVTSTNAGTGNTATASLVVAAVAPTAAPTSPAATAPPTSTGSSDVSGGSNPALPLVLLLALAAGFVTVRRAEIRGQHQGLR